MKRAKKIETLEPNELISKHPGDLFRKSRVSVLGLVDKNVREEHIRQMKRL